jgi:hypothetical protein
MVISHMYLNYNDNTYIVKLYYNNHINVIIRYQGC